MTFEKYTYKKYEYSGLKIGPGQKIPDEILTRLKMANQNLTKDRNFQKYQDEIKHIFRLNAVKITTETKLFLGGFIEGEGSLNVSAKKQASAAMGLVIDPEFSITQHINGVSSLYLALAIFQTGRISYKSGSNATLVFRIDNRKTLQDKVMPFYKYYVYPYGSVSKIKRAEIFQKLLNLFEQKAHLNFDRFTNKVLPLWDSLRIQVNASNQTCLNLNQAKKFVQETVANKLKLKD